jgi:hypothetical protein
VRNVETAEVEHVKSEEQMRMEEKPGGELMVV